MPNVPPIRTFLSCSVRPADGPTVNAFRHVLQSDGFVCTTVGTDYSAPESTADSTRSIMRQSEYLVIVATPRFNAKDVRSGSRFDLPPGWVDSEAGLAHAQEIPITVFKHRTVTLQGLLSANMTQHFEFDFGQETPATYFLRNVPLLRTHFNEVKRRIKARRDQQNTNLLKKVLGYGGGAIALFTAGASLSNPDYPGCFGGYDGRTRKCRECWANGACEKQRDKKR